MFALFGKIIAKGWPVFLGCWALLAAFATWAAPPWKKVADDREFRFLPDESPSRQAEAIFHAAFPQQLLASNVVIVLYRTDQKLTGADYKFADKVLKPGLTRIVEEEGGFAAPSPSQSANSSDMSGQPIITKISTAFDPGTGPLLISEDHRATLVVVDLTTEFMEIRNWTTLRKIEDLLAKLQADRQLPSGLHMNLTGSATIGRDVGLGQVQSASTTERWTVVLVISLLLLIYRAPVLAIVPLVTIFIALQISLKLLSLAAEAGVTTLFEGIQIYITIILYGAGVDYCLFLIARYREELDGGQDMAAALAGAINKTGPSLAASAATVMFGIGMMTFAGFGKFHYAGIAIFFSLFIGLCAILTLAAPLLRLTGRWAFWPKMPPGLSDAAPGKSPEQPRKWSSLIWEKLANWLVRRPGTIWLTSVALMTPFVVVAVRTSSHVNYDLLERLPADAPGRLGTEALAAHFSSGVTGPITVLIHNPHVDFRTDDNLALIKTLTERLKEHRKTLALTDIRGLASPLGLTKAGKVTGPPQAVVPFLPKGTPLGTGPSIFDPGWSTSFGEGFTLGEDYQRQKIMRQKALEHYVSSAGSLKGHVTQFQLLVDMNPLSTEGAARLDEVKSAVRAALPAELASDTKLYFIGPTASVRDLIAVTGSDAIRVKVLVTGCVFLILLILLRRLVIPVYLVASVLFSFFTTLGVSYACFWALDPQSFPGLDWKVPILLFTVLVAIGEDYNIFLMTRVDEEQQGRQPIEGITQALVKTGGIITSCGLIMAGTFGSLMTGSLVDLKQLGFALAFGVLLDAFVVRPILVPAFLILLNRRRRPRPGHV